MVRMTKKSQEERRRELADRLEPFETEEERQEAVRNLRRWIAKLQDWDEEHNWNLKIRVSDRDLN